MVGDQEVREWYKTTYGEEGAERIREGLTWNGFLEALTEWRVQDVVLDAQTQTRCIWRISEILRINPDILMVYIKGGK